MIKHDRLRSINDVFSNLEPWESYDHREWHKFSHDVDITIEEEMINGDTPETIPDRQGD